MDEIMREDVVTLNNMLEQTEEGGEQLAVVLNDDREAERLVQYIIWCNEQKETWKAFYADRLKKLNDQMDHKIAWAEKQLRDFFFTVPHRVAKNSESYTLPTGKLTYKFGSQKMEHDDAQLLPWLKENAKGFVKSKTEESVDWAGLKKTLKIVEGQAVNADGEIVPGVIVSMKADEFKVEV